MFSDIWYSPQTIRFTKLQFVSFLLPNLLYIRDGIWPPEGRTTGYVESSNKPSYRAGAYFETISNIAAEIDTRMSLIGSMSEILERIYTLNEEPLQVARDFKMTEEDLTYHCRKMLSFISGYKRKRESYHSWLRYGNITKLVLAIS